MNSGDIQFDQADSMSGEKCSIDFARRIDFVRVLRLTGNFSKFLRHHLRKNLGKD